MFPDSRLVVDRVTSNAHILEAGTQSSSYRLRTSKTSKDGVS